jgi:hypothetical protein
MRFHADLHRVVIAAGTALAAAFALAGHDTAALLAGLATNQLWIWSN